jgi:hypothetical protein
MDYETRYGTALERIAQLEEDLVEKAIMAEEVQRLKDEVKGIERMHTHREWNPKLITFRCFRST